MSAAPLVLLVLQAGPDPAIAPLLEAGRAALRADRPLDAIPPLAQAVMARPEAADAHYYLGVALYRAREFRQAVFALERADRLAPGHEETEWHLGLAASGEGDYALAAVAFEKVLARRPDRADALFNLGVVLTRRGDPARAIEVLRRAQRLGPSRPELPGVLAEALFDRTEYEEAEAVLRKALSRSPADGALLGLLGRVLLQRGQCPGAVEALDRAWAAGNESAEVLRNRSLARTRAGDLEGAEKDCRAVLERSPYEGGMLYHLATLLQRRGRAEEARKIFERYREEGALFDDLRANVEKVRRNPVDVQGHLNLAYLYMRFDDLRRASEEIRRAIELSPPLAEDRAARGILRLAEGKAEEAREEFGALLGSRPEFPDVHLYLQRCCERIGDAEAAARYRDRFLALTASKRR